jgi:predicted Zn-dependent peptidase
MLENIRIKPSITVAKANAAMPRISDAIGTQPATAEQATEAILAEYKKLAQDSLTEQELAEGKQQFKGQVMLSLENPISRMNRLAAVALHQDRYRPLNQVLAEIDGVTPADVATLAQEFFAPDRQTVLRLGPN